MSTALLRLIGRWPPDLRAVAVVVVLVLAGVWAVQPNAFGLGQVDQPPAATVAADATPDTQTRSGFLPQHREPELRAQPTFTWSSALGLVVKLAIVIALIYLSARALRFVLARAGVGPARDGPVEVLTTVPLGPRKLLHLVGLGDRLLLIGSTDQQVGLLTEIHDPAEVARLREQAGLSQPASFTNGQFASQLHRALADTSVVGSGPNGHPASVSTAPPPRRSAASVSDAPLRHAVARLRASRSRLGGQPATGRRTALSASLRQRESQHPASASRAAAVAAAAIAAAQAANQAAARQAYAPAPPSPGDENT